MEQPGLSLSEVMISVRNEVLKTTAGKQVPWEHSSLTGQFYFKPVEAGSATAVDQSGLEVAFWNSIQGSKNPQLFEAYLRRYPNGAFAEIAKINLQEVKVAAAVPIAPDEKAPLSDTALLREINERLYELNFDTEAGASGERMRAAIRQFEGRVNLAQTGVPTRGLLGRLRDLGGLKPWGAIVYSKSDGKWGMSWDHKSRQAAVDDARKTCGASTCTVESQLLRNLVRRLRLVGRKLGDVHPRRYSAGERGRARRLRQARKSLQNRRVLLCRRRGQGGIALNRVPGRDVELRRGAKRKPLRTFRHDALDFSGHLRGMTSE